MEINWDEMGEDQETGFEQQADDLQEQAEEATGFLFPEDFEDDE